MPEVIKALYAHGVFKPLQALAIPDGQHVRLVVEATDITTSEDLLALAAHVYEGLSPEEVEAIEEMACNRRDSFGEATS